MFILTRAALRAACVSGVLSFAASTGWTESLTDALIAAYQNSNLLEQNQALLRAADDDVAVAVAALRPVIAYTARASASHSDLNGNDRSASIELSGELVLYDGGDSRLGIDVAKETVLATRATLVSIEQEVLLSAVQAYMDLRSATQNVLLSESNVRLISQELQAARDRFEVGEVTRTDVSLAEAALAAARSGLVANQGQLTVARESYRRVTGKYPQNLSGNVRLPKLPASLREAIAIAQRQHPDIVGAQHGVKVAELNVLRSRAAKRPKVTANVALGLDEDRNDSSSVSLSMRQTIYSGGAIDALERRAINQKQASRAILLNTGSSSTKSA